MSPVWLAGTLMTAFIGVCALSFGRTEANTSLGLFVRSAAMLAMVAVAALFLDRTAKQERAAERRALEARESALTSLASAPTSALGCLDATAGETIERLCEKVIFSTPEATAAAVSFVSGRLTLLADEFAYANRHDNSFETSFRMISRAVELDRFGLYSHVLAVRYGCVPGSCPAFAFLSDASRISENLRTKKLDYLIGRYAASWQSPGTALAGDAPQAKGVSIMNPEPAPSWQSPGAAPAPNPPTSKPTRSRGIDFPSAASIPPVSIMNPEPAGPPTGGTRVAPKH
jgi:hypothetical protein